MNNEEALQFEKNIAREIANNDGDYHNYRFGRLHPSHISGCPLGTVLDFMLEDETPLNCHMFNGKAVHYFLQEENIIDRALHDMGFHHLDTNHEVNSRFEVPGVDDDLQIIGRADTITTDGDRDVVIDIKYSSLKPEYKNNRLIKYAAQINAYSFMFDADAWVLLFVYSKADDITDPEESINTLVGEPNEENWELMLEKARSIHQALSHFGWDEGNRWDKEELKYKDRDFWEDVMQFFDESWVPAYEGELKWSDRDEWVMPYKSEWDTTGIASFKK